MISALIRWPLANRLAVVILSAMLAVVGAFMTTTVPQGETTSKAALPLVRSPNTAIS